MGILVSKAQSHHKEFKLIITIEDDDVTFSFHGGEGISAHKIGFLLNNIMAGNFNLEILDAMERWGDGDDIFKVMKIINAWTENKKEDSEEENERTDYSVHPLDTFTLLGKYGAGHGPNNE